MNLSIKHPNENAKYSDASANHSISANHPNENATQLLCVGLFLTLSNKGGHFVFDAHLPSILDVTTILVMAAHARTKRLGYEFAFFVSVA